MEDAWWQEYWQSVKFGPVSNESRYFAQDSAAIYPTAAANEDENSTFQNPRYAIID